MTYLYLLSLSLKLSLTFSNTQLLNCIAVPSTGMSLQGAMMFDLLSCSNIQKYGTSERGRREANDNYDIPKEEKRGKLFNVICEAPNSVQFLFPMV